MKHVIHIGLIIVCAVTITLGLFARIATRQETRQRTEQRIEYRTEQEVRKKSDNSLVGRTVKGAAIGAATGIGTTMALGGGVGLALMGTGVGIPGGVIVLGATAIGAAIAYLSGSPDEYYTVDVKVPYTVDVKVPYEVTVPILPPEVGYSLMLIGVLGLIGVILSYSRKTKVTVDTSTGRVVAPPVPNY